LTITKTKLANALGGKIHVLHWLTDKKSGAFYGSCIVQMVCTEEAKAATEQSLKIDKKKVKVSFCEDKAGESWPPTDLSDREFPPVGS